MTPKQREAVLVGIENGQKAPKSKDNHKEYQAAVQLFKNQLKRVKNMTPEGFFRECDALY